MTSRPGIQGIIFAIYTWHSTPTDGTGIPHDVNVHWQAPNKGISNSQEIHNHSKAILPFLQQHHWLPQILKDDHYQRHASTNPNPKSIDDTSAVLCFCPQGPYHVIEKIFPPSCMTRLTTNKTTTTNNNNTIKDIFPNDDALLIVHLGKNICNNGNTTTGIQQQEYNNRSTTTRI